MSDPLDILRPDYDGFITSSYPEDMGGWGSDAPIFEQLIRQTAPHLIIEVGSWKGASAIHMAGICDELGLDAPIVCVDTWLGSLEMWTDPADPTRYGSLQRIYGYPQIYYQFVANVIRAHHQERILPFPQTSAIAARWLAGQQIQADLIYLDASHDEEDVLTDLRGYWPLVRKGGVLFGDDHDTFFGQIRNALDRFGRPYAVQGGRYWVMQ